MNPARKYNTQSQRHVRKKIAEPPCPKCSGENGRYNLITDELLEGKQNTNGKYTRPEWKAPRSYKVMPEVIQ